MFFTKIKLISAFAAYLAFATMGVGVIVKNVFADQAETPISADNKTDDKAKNDLKKFQGNWKLVEVQHDGKGLPPEGLADLKELDAVVKDNVVILKEKGEVKDGWNVSFKLDAAKKPKEFYLTMSIRDGKPKTSKGIYRFDGDKLTICIREPGKDRPKEFTTKKGPDSYLWTLEKKK